MKRSLGWSRVYRLAAIAAALLLIVAAVSAPGQGTAQAGSSAPGAVHLAPAITTNCTGGAADGLVHDDGTFENGRGNITTPLVELFTLPGAPYQVQQVCVCLMTIGTSGATANLDVVFYQAGPTPGVELARFGPFTASNVPAALSYAWYDFPLTYDAAAGPVFIGIDFADPTLLFLCGDESAGTPDHENFHYEILGGYCAAGTWCAESFKAYGLRAEVGIAPVGPEPEPEPAAVVPGCDARLNIPATAVVGKFVDYADVYWKPGALTVGPVVLPAGQSAWVLGVDSSGEYYQILWSCEYLWVHVDTMGPNYDDTWQGRPLPTDVIETPADGGDAGGSSLS